jgi:L-amino acid N-acyltransferase YncA
VTDIRAYRDADFDALLAIMNQVIARGDAFVYDRPLDADGMRRWIATYAHAFVAEHDGRVVGGYFLRPNLLGRGSHVCNAAYMVAEATRGLGVGNLMGEHSLATANSLGYAGMQFRVHERAGGGAVATARLQRHRHGASRLP